jgi:hypothetical protein
VTQVTFDTANTQWIVYSPVDPNIAYFMTYTEVAQGLPIGLQIKMIDFSTPENMVTLIAGGLPGLVPGDGGCYFDVLNALLVFKGDPASVGGPKTRRLCFK